jgi:hypothetical protein
MMPGLPHACRTGSDKITRPCVIAGSPRPDRQLVRMPVQVCWCWRCRFCMTELLLVILCAYLLGSVSGSLVLGRLRGVDIRSSGSGNAGGTNALRSQGVTFALLVIVIDIGKGVLAVLYLPAWWPAANADLAAWQPVSAGLAAIIGHVWPLYLCGLGQCLCWTGLAGGRAALANRRRCCQARLVSARRAAALVRVGAVVAAAVCRGQCAVCAVDTSQQHSPSAPGS